MPPEPSDADNARELDALRSACWRQAHEIHALQATVATLRTGANRLAADNAFLSAELAIIEPSAPLGDLRLLPGGKSLLG